ncbi:MAG: hypothetical protein FWC55_01000 [Firmicutes bacterium]|nr:hypothetical protein [Bacillota bacterium]
MNDIFDRAMREVLKQRKYDVLTGRSIDVRKVITQFIQRLLERILGRLHITLPGGVSVPSWVGHAVLAAAALAVFAAAALIVRRAVRRRRLAPAVPVGDIFAGVELTSLERLLKDCAAFAAAGDFREALRRMYIALLWSLDAAGIISLDKAKTNGQLKREVSMSAPAYARDFDALSDAFGFAWYGKKGVDAGKWGGFSQKAEALMREARNENRR